MCCEQFRAQTQGMRLNRKRALNHSPWPPSAPSPPHIYHGCGLFFVPVHWAACTPHSLGTNTDLVSSTERGIYRDVLRDANNVKVARGTLVEGKDERKIFAHLGVTWREPHERWCS